MTTNGLEITADENDQLFTTQMASKLVGTSIQMLRVYKKHGFIIPLRKHKSLLFTKNDITWLCCLREMIHDKKLSIEAIKKLLNYASCWELNECPGERRDGCRAFQEKAPACVRGVLSIQDVSPAHTREQPHLPDQGKRHVASAHVPHEIERTENQRELQRSAHMSKAPAKRPVTAYVQAK